MGRSGSDPGDVPVGIPAELSAALDAVAATRHLLVTSDFDGTLAPIVNDPADARPLADAATALVALAELPSTDVALVSGRALATLREYSGMPAGVHLVGSHGAEFDSGFAHDVDRELLARITADLVAIADGRPGVTVETKPASVALHVRNASAEDGASAIDAARIVGETSGAELTEGKSVAEFAVISTDKGEAVDILRERTAATAVVFLGDDVTDEKAFRRLRDGDVGVKVGPGESAARYRVSAPEDVADALTHLLAARRDVTSR